MKRRITTWITALAALTTVGCGGDWHDASLAPSERARLLVREMTLDEKIGQLQSPYGWEMYERDGDSILLTERFRQAVEEEHLGMMWGLFRADPWTKKDLRTGLVPRTAARLANRMQHYAITHSRLGIPLFMAEEAPHGHMAIGATVFPTALGQASTWNPELIEQVGATVATEIRLQGAHICYGPVLDITRDPRWSRVEESYGEDPYLAATMGAAYVTGAGSRDLSQRRHALSTLKHFIAYGASEAGQNGGSHALGEREVREYFLPSFEAAVRAGARSVMTAYNSIDGVPCTANYHTLTEILRDEWGFDGFVISDLVSIEGLYETHHVAEDINEAARMALAAGVDVDLRGAAFETLKQSVAEGLVSERRIDRAVERVLALKFEMGLFENPYVDEEEAEEVGSVAHTDIAKDVACQAITLLENRHATLPLNPATLRRVALVGPNADAIYNQLGDYTAPQQSANTIRDGLERLLGKERVDYVRGCAVRDPSRAEIPAAVAAAQRADVVVAVVGGSSGRDYTTEYLETGAAKAKNTTVADMECGEGNDRATLKLLGAQQELLEALKRTGKPLVVVYIAGRPMDMTWAAEHADALLMAWYPGGRGGDAVAEVLTGVVNPAGHLPVTIPRSEGQLPLYYNKRQPANHNYTDLEASPLYPFGYGLSYSTFAYDRLHAEVAVDGSQVEVTCTVENLSERDGDEVVQLYMTDVVASTVRPARQLVAFRRLHIAAGEQVEVHFTLPRERFSLINREGCRTVEPGEFRLAVGTSSADMQCETTITL